MERPPFNFPNPLGLFGGTKQVGAAAGAASIAFNSYNTVISIHPQISAEAAYLYDAVHLYANALLSVLDAGGRPRNGTAIVAAIKGSRYRSAMG